MAYLDFLVFLHKMTSVFNVYKSFTGLEEYRTKSDVTRLDTFIQCDKRICNCAL